MDHTEEGQIANIQLRKKTFPKKTRLTNGFHQFFWEEKIRN